MMDKKFAALSLAVCVAVQGLVGFASVILPDQAVVAARNWLNGEAMLEAGIPHEPVGVRTVDGRYHVVSLAGGGYVILSADDGIEPVIAFSASGDFPEQDEKSSVRALLARDMGERLADLAVTRPFKQRAFAVNAKVLASAPEAKWAHLLEDLSPNVKLRAYASGKASIGDARVGPLVASKWGQGSDTGYSNTGSPCYNLYTPNNCPCGCVATGLAQLMRYWEYPSSVAAFSRTCEVNGNATTLSVSAGSYAWDDMPLDPARGTTAVQRQAIGKLTYACSVAMGTSFWWCDGAGAFGSFAFEPLQKIFKYANAMSFCPDSITADEIERGVFSSLDAGSPVLMEFAGGVGDLHAVLADGYGFVSQTPYVHLNVGWTAISGSDLWYNLPHVTFTMGSSSYAYTVIDGIIYNVFPSMTGDVLSGRVTDASGTPVGGVTVTVSKNGKKDVLATVQTSQLGVYAFVLPGGAKYDVSAGDAKKTGINLVKSGNPREVNFVTGSYSSTGMVLGNSWGNDLVLGQIPDPVNPPPAPAPSDEQTVDVSCALDGAVLTLGQEVFEPINVSCTACQVKSIKVSGLPSGLKLLSGKKAAPYDYAISGVPKKASDKPFSARITVQVKADDAKTKIPAQQFPLSLEVLPLPDWSVGSFSGLATVENEIGAFTLSVNAKSSAISGKVTIGKKSYSYKATGFKAVSDEECHVCAEIVKLGVQLDFDIIPQAFGTMQVGVVTNGGIRAAQEIWKLSAYKKFLKKYTSPDKAISWTTAGKVTLQKLSTDGKKATKLTSTLLPVSSDGNDTILCAYFIGGDEVTQLKVKLSADGSEPVYTLERIENMEQ